MIPVVQGGTLRRVVSTEIPTRLGVFRTLEKFGFLTKLFWCGGSALRVTTGYLNFPCYEQLRAS
jgi:hypothetical protein